MSDNHIHQLNVDGKEIILIGTAHVSRQSAEEVKKIIEREQPDSVCIELDEGRYKSLMEQNKWENTDIIQVIKEKKAILLLVNLVLSAYQKKMANQFDIQPGQEMIQGIESAKKIQANIVLADRDIQITFKRIWRGITAWSKVKLFFSIILSIFDEEEITEEELEKMKTEDMLTSALNELSSDFPGLKKHLVDERDQHLAQKIKEAPGQKIIVVLGAAHISGVKKELFKEHNLKKLTEIPEKPKSSKLIGWMIPLAIIFMVISTFSVDAATGMDQIISWILWNGSLSAIGTVIAGGHILSILTAFLAAPITSLHPLLAAGWFAALTEAFIRKPRVRDFENLTKDISTIKGFWKNRVIRILLVVILANLGSVIGTWISGIDIIRSFIKSIS